MTFRLSAISEKYEHRKGFVFFILRLSTNHSAIF